VRTSWYLRLSQPKSVAKTLGSIRLMPESKVRTSLVLFEDDVLALVEHLLIYRYVEVISDKDGFEHTIENGPAVSWERSHQPEKKRKKKPQRR
jgi:hypothetical protein